MFRGIFIAVLAFGLLGCGDDGVSSLDDKLSTNQHDAPRTFWGTSPITADVRWQMKDFVEAEEGIRVALDYDIIFINPSDTVYTISVTRISFEYRSMTQLAAYEPEEGIVTGVVAAGGAVQVTSEAQIDVPSILDANRIRNLVIWATFRMGTADG
ncbi:MAG: hypothetical protein VX656_19085 [Candidatus Latescibacterota bacterium]|nr:hypothetical protein [Candidatus Latescibacterota bacterium]